MNYFPQHFLYFLPLPHGQGSFLPTVFSLTTVLVFLYDFSISSFYCTNGQTQEKSNVPLIITRLGETTATIPEKMFPYGKTEDILIDLTRSPSEINQYSEN